MTKERSEEQKNRENQISGSPGFLNGTIRYESQLITLLYHCSVNSNE
jgi:hypothetical protein